MAPNSGPVISNWMPPHRQLPRMALMLALLACRYVAAFCRQRHAAILHLARREICDTLPSQKNPGRT
jgi:hypothetical protein